jgi:CARDB protein/PLAT/LH2 domain-containing protein
VRRALAIMFALGLCLSPASAQAFDTGPHADMTRDALTAEGFGRAGADVGMINNWFVDYYTNPGKNPYSGHASALIGWTRFGLDHETWLNVWVEGARRMHFDSESRLPGMPDLSNTAGIDKEWKRLMFLTRQWVQYAGRQQDPVQVMAVLGISLHAVQDFYSHSNWVENLAATPGRGGPGLNTLGVGDTPTWFDVPPEKRAQLVGVRAVYTGVKGIPRQHGNWQSNKNKSLKDGLNKDWPGRPKYEKAYVSAYFASRQWIRAAREWLGNEPLWKRAMTLPNTAALRHDVAGAEEISQFSGHWQGGGEPSLPFLGDERSGFAGSVVSLRIALGDFHDRGPSRYRKAFQDYIGAYSKYSTDPIDMPDLPSSRTDQVFTRFVKLQVLGYKGIDLGDIGSDADIYANARMDGQSYTSTIINDEDSFSFPGSYAPFTWIRAVPTFNSESTPIESITVRVETGNRSSAGTDDDVYLNIGSHRFSLDKRLYDDFERGDDDTYAVAIGNATRDGLTIGDIGRVSIEKSKDGHAGGWFLHGVTVTVNGQTFMRNRSIDRWLEKSSRVWTAPGLTRDHRTSDVIPIWLQLREDDFGPQDTGDVNVFDRNTSLPIAYRLGTTVHRTVTGAARLSGRLSMDNGDKARVTYLLNSFAEQPPPPPVPPPQNNPPVTPPPGPPGDADLIITSLTTTNVTVKNQGTAAAGAFNVSITNRGTVRFAGLAAGASATMDYTNTNCEAQYSAVADSLNEVPESNESNNTKIGLDGEPPIC